MKLQGARRLLVWQIAGSLIAVAAAFVVGGFLMLAISVNPLEVYAKLIDGVLLNPYGIAQIFFKATPLIMTGLSVAVAFKTGLFNIGGEGQMLVGAFCAALAGASFDFPWFMQIPLCLAAAFFGGVLWASIPGYLKAKTGGHEVITTIMMNFIAQAATNYMITAYFHEPETVHTAAIGPTSILPRLDVLIPMFHGSPANFSFLIALALCGFIWWLLWKTPLGYELRAVGLNPAAAETAGIPVSDRMFLSFAVAGGLAGLAGTNFVMGYKHYFEEGFSGGSGFVGIAVALLGQNHPIGVVLAALLFGGLSHGALVINAVVPKEIIEVLQALVIIFVIVTNECIRRHLARRASIEEGA